MATTYTVGSSRTYATLQAAWNALPSTLADDYIFDCYNDGLISGTLDTAANTKTFAGFSLTIKPATGQGFRDDSGKATNALRFDQANGVAFDVSGFITIGVNLQQSGSTIVVDGLQFKTNAYECLRIGAGTVTVKNCLFEGDYGGRDVVLPDASGASVINCVVIQKSSTGGGINSTTTATLRNNTVCYVGSGTSSRAGIYSQFNVCTAIGNAVFGYGTAMSAVSGGSWHASSDYNATDQSATGTGTGSNNVVSLTRADQFEAVGTAGSEDLRLKSGNGLAGEGVYDAAMDPDILGYTRATPPAIGAVEPIVALPADPSSVVASSVLADRATISWTDNSTETGFKVRYAPSPYSSYTTATGSVAASPYIITGLTDGTSYKAGVAAFSGAGDSSWVESGVFTTTTLAKLRPAADTSSGSWSASSGSVLYSMIDEVVADDADYVTASSNTIYKMKLEAGTDPVDDTSHSIRIRARSTSGTFGVRLVQGDPSETTLASWSVALTASFADYDLTMTTAEASAITDYSALYIKLISS